VQFGYPTVVGSQIQLLLVDIVILHGKLMRAEENRHVQQRNAETKPKAKPENFVISRLQNNLRLFGTA
jgi:hypothetical protein